ncbi:MAG: hypothetical protein ACPGUD_08925 [Parashewanella sp.]
MSVPTLTVYYLTKVNSFTVSGEKHRFEASGDSITVGQYTFNLGDDGRSLIIKASKDALENFFTHTAYHAASYEFEDENGTQVTQALLGYSQQATSLRNKENKPHAIIRALTNRTTKTNSALNALLQRQEKHRKVAYHSVDTLKRDLRTDIRIHQLTDNNQHLDLLRWLAFVDPAKGEEIAQKIHQCDFVFKDIKEERIAAYKEHARRILKRVDEYRALQFALQRHWTVAEFDPGNQQEQVLTQPAAHFEAMNTDDETPMSRRPHAAEPFTFDPNHAETEETNLTTDPSNNVRAQRAHIGGGLETNEQETSAQARRQDWLQNQTHLDPVITEVTDDGEERNTAQ